MIDLPGFEKDFLWENSFYLSCDITRISKSLAQYELFKLVQDVPGAIVECGVFKGASLVRFAAFRELLGNTPFQSGSLPSTRSAIFHQQSTGRTRLSATNSSRRQVTKASRPTK